MKRAIIIAIVLIIPISALSATSRYQNSEAEKVNAAVQEIDIPTFTGEPECKYKIISPVSGTSSSADRAFGIVKRKATKLGADAIIQLKTEMVPQGSSSSWLNKNGGSGFGSVSTSPVVSGLAVRCL